MEISHAAAYRGRDRFPGRRVLVVANSISGLEIAADLADDASITCDLLRPPRTVDHP